MSKLLIYMILQQHTESMRTDNAISFEKLDYNAIRQQLHTFSQQDQLRQSENNQIAIDCGLIDLFQKAKFQTNYKHFSSVNLLDNEISCWKTPGVHHFNSINLSQSLKNVQQSPSQSKMRKSINSHKKMLKIRQIKENSMQRKSNLVNSPYRYTFLKNNISNHAIVIKNPQLIQIQLKDQCHSIQTKHMPSPKNLKLFLPNPNQKQQKLPSIHNINQVNQQQLASLSQRMKSKCFSLQYNLQYLQKDDKCILGKSILKSRIQLQAIRTKILKRKQKLYQLSKK